MAAKNPMRLAPTPRTRFLFTLFIGLLFSPAPCTSLAQPPDEPLTRILFGSCFKQGQPAPIFQTMHGQQPDLLLFIGDNIYADTSNMDVMRTKYAQLAADPGFKLLRSNHPILATWDDHDYGKNDAGADYPQREQAERVFLDFWEVPENSPRRRRPGIYMARTIGPPGQRTQIILLDTRYHRSPLKTGARRTGGPYVPDDAPHKTMLGAQQWEWLDQQFRQPAEVRILATSIQCLAEDAGQETWSNLPRERIRLLQLIADTKANGVIMISGDRHWAELSAVTEDVPYPLFELTSSSFNQLHQRGTPTRNRYRAAEQTYHRENFGVIRIDWSPDDPRIELEIRDLKGARVFGQQLRLSQLQPAS